MHVNLLYVWAAPCHSTELGSLTVDVPLTDFDLRQWCRQLGITLKGIFSSNEAWPENHLLCIRNLDDFGGVGIHSVWCRRGEGGENEYFDSFRLPPPLEWENKLILEVKKMFLRIDNQLQWEWSVRCGCYLLFLNECHKGRPFQEILSKFSDDVRANKEVVKNYFSR